MRRRDFIRVLGGAAATWPVAARAQQASVPIVGYIDVFAPETGASYVAAFRKGLNEAGFVDGRNVAIEYRSTYDRAGGSAQLAAEFVRRRVSIIVSSSLNTALAAKAATTTIPIIFNAGGDPVAAGLVASLNQPGGNVTGVSSLGGALGCPRPPMICNFRPGSARSYRGWRYWAGPSAAMCESSPPGPDPMRLTFASNLDSLGY
jgi:putative ABC transport system substrate-binding protein